MSCSNVSSFSSWALFSVSFAFVASGGDGIDDGENDGDAWLLLQGLSLLVSASCVWTVVSDVSPFIPTARLLTDLASRAEGDDDDDDDADDDIADNDDGDEIDGDVCIKLLRLSFLVSAGCEWTVVLDVSPSSQLFKPVLFKPVHQLWYNVGTVFFNCATSAGTVRGCHAGVQNQMLHVF